MTPADPAGARRECEHKHANHQHGTLIAYINDRCRCPECRAANAARGRLRRRQIAYDRHTLTYTPAAPVARRVEALMALGWSLRALSRHAWIDEDRLSRILADTKGTVHRRNAERVARLYDELWATPPPCRNTSERISVAQALGRARRRGYRLPLEWDDIDAGTLAPTPARGAPPIVDPVAVERAAEGRPVKLNHAERTAATRLMWQRGWSITAIARALHMSTSTVNRELGHAA